MENSTSVYPRALTAREREWLAWVLPTSRPGYREVLELAGSLMVIGEGRRGQGEWILGTAGDRPDFSAPLTPVFAYGVIETDRGAISVTVREMLDNQISIEIVSNQDDELPVDFVEKRRWTYSSWEPGRTCPQCLAPVREVPMHTPEGRKYVFVLCPHDRRIWVYDEASRINRLLPVTQYYNELMLHQKIRDPKIALDANRLFEDLGEFSDELLVKAFHTYNILKKHVPVDGQVETDQQEEPGMFRRIALRFTRRGSGTK